MVKRQIVWSEPESSGQRSNPSPRCVSSRSLIDFGFFLRVCVWHGGGQTAGRPEWPSERQQAQWSALSRGPQQACRRRERGLRDVGTGGSGRVARAWGAPCSTRDGPPRSSRAVVGSLRSVRCGSWRVEESEGAVGERKAARRPDGSKSEWRRPARPCVRLPASVESWGGAGGEAATSKASGVKRAAGRSGGRPASGVKRAAGRSGGRPAHCGVQVRWQGGSH